MPSRIRLIGRYGNGVVAALFGFLFLFALTKGDLGFALLFAGLGGLAVFNVYLTEKAAAISSEEEWLNAEIRKAELRRRLIRITADSPETVSRQHGI